MSAPAGLGERAVGGSERPLRPDIARYAEPAQRLNCRSAVGAGSVPLDFAGDDVGVAVSFAGLEGRESDPGGVKLLVSQLDVKEIECGEAIGGRQRQGAAEALLRPARLPLRSLASPR